MEPAPRSTLELAAQIVAAAITAKYLSLAPDPRSKQQTAEHDASQLGRAFTLVHEAIYNEHRRISGTK